MIALLPSILPSLVLTLKYVLVFALAMAVALGILWLLWMIVSALDEAQERGALPPFTEKVGKGIYCLALGWDIACNLIPCLFLFLDIPREPTVSERLRKLVKGKDGRRKRMAIWCAVNLINPFSRGKLHIPLQ